jgi:hypothetical protein
MKIEVQGRQVEVDNDFASLSPEEQQKTVDDISAQLGHHETARAEINQQREENAQGSWKENPYIAGPVAAVTEAGRLAYEHPLAAAGVATALGTAASKIPVVGPAVGSALGNVAGAFVPQRVQQAATGLSNLASGVANGVNQWGQNVATTAAQKNTTSALVHYNNIMDRIRLMGDAASPQDIELAKNLHSKLIGESAPPVVRPTGAPTTVSVPTTGAANMPTNIRTVGPVQPTVAQQVQQVAAQHVQGLAPAANTGESILQRIAPYINNPLTRGIAKLGGVGGQMATYSQGLNTNEEEELRRRRGMGPTIR